MLQIVGALFSLCSALIEGCTVVNCTSQCVHNVYYTFAQCALYSYQAAK